MSHCEHQIPTGVECGYCIKDARIAQLEAALLKYGYHEAGCDYLLDTLPCTCGFEAVRATLETACKHPLETMNHHGSVTGIVNDFRCTLCDLVMPLTDEEVSRWYGLHSKTSAETPEKPGIVEDGFGSAWTKCVHPECDLHVARPGKSQCSGFCEGATSKTKGEQT